jgi:hypothetical protein
MTNKMSEISLGMENNELIPLASKEKMLSRKEAAEFLGLRENTLAIWAIKKRYDLPMYKVGKNIKYKITDLQKFQEGQSIHGMLDYTDNKKPKKLRNSVNAAYISRKANKSKQFSFKQLHLLVKKAISFVF